MNENDVNRLLFLTLNGLSEIGSSKVSMWSISNKYAYPPYFSFKFKQDDKQLYDRLLNAINAFGGHFLWVMKKFDHPASTYIIAPQGYIDKLGAENGESVKDILLKDMTLQEYQTMIDMVIKEIPGLANHINRQCAD